MKLRNGFEHTPNYGTEHTHQILTNLLYCIVFDLLIDTQKMVCCIKDKVYNEKVVLVTWKQ